MELIQWGRRLRISRRNVRILRARNKMSSQFEAISTRLLLLIQADSNKRSFLFPFSLREKRVTRKLWIPMNGHDVIRQLNRWQNSSLPSPKKVGQSLLVTHQA